MLSNTRGRVLFEGGNVVPPRGTIGIVPQKNVLFDDLTCRQTLKLWRAIKATTASNEEDIDQLLRDCDLENKINANASTLSGGQKRKLQLAIGLVGRSKIVLVDEVGHSLWFARMLVTRIRSAPLGWIPSQDEHFGGPSTRSGTIVRSFLQHM